jgi:hypothetical protein
MSLGSWTLIVAIIATTISIVSSSSEDTHLSLEHNLLNGFKVIFTEHRELTLKDDNTKGHELHIY